MFLDATYCKARVGGRVVSQAVVIATGVTADGHREVLGCRCRRQRERGSSGPSSCATCATVACTGPAGHLRRPPRPDAAIGAVLQRRAWQRCRVHFMRNVLAKVPKGHAEMVAAAIRTIFAQPDREPSAPSSTTSPALLGQPVPRRRRTCCATPRPT